MESPHTYIHISQENELHERLSEINVYGGSFSRVPTCICTHQLFSFAGKQTRRIPIGNKLKYVAHHLTRCMLILIGYKQDRKICLQAESNQSTYKSRSCSQNKKKLTRWFSPDTQLIVVDQDLKLFKVIMECANREPCYHTTHMALSTRLT